MRTFEEVVKDVEETQKRCEKLYAQYNEKREHSFRELTYIETALSTETKHMEELYQELKELKRETMKDVISEILQAKINAVYGIEP